MSSAQFAKLETRAVASLAGLYASRMLGLFMVLPVLALYIDGYLGSSPLWLGLIIGGYGLTQAAVCWCLSPAASSRPWLAQCRSY
jgi:type III secretory pathway component EscT